MRTREELRDALKARETPDIVAERLASDLTTSRPDSDHALDTLGCVFDSGAGRCDGAYHHLNKLHFSVARNELWESPL